MPITDTLTFGPNHKSAGSVNNVNSLPPTTYYLNRQMYETKLVMEASAGGGGGGANAYFHWVGITSNRRAGGGGGQTGARVTYKFGRYVPFFELDGTYNILGVGICDMTVYSQLYSTLLGAGGISGTGAYNDSGDVARATASSGGAGGDARITFIPPGMEPTNYAIIFEASGGARGTGADCKAQMSGDQFSRVGIGGKSEYCGTIQTRVGGNYYLTSFLLPDPSNPDGNMRVDINGTIFDNNTYIVDTDGNRIGEMTFSNKKVTIDLYAYDSLSIERETSAKANGEDGKNTGGDEVGGAGGASTYGGVGGTGGSGKNSSAASNTGNPGTSSSYIQLTSKYYYELPYEICLGENPETHAPVWTSQNDVTVVKTDSGYTSVKSAEVYDGSQWKRIGPTDYTWSSGEYT